MYIPLVLYFFFFSLAFFHAARRKHLVVLNACKCNELHLYCWQEPSLRSTLISVLNLIAALQC